MANRLAQETSPYLLQHRDNPVDWYPWGEEALARARRENKPILLSIGYSACHWCHVMAHESFENEAIARQMNEHFVNIKVDREERPDLDHIYQNVAQALTRSGGWPLTVFLTPELKPFFGGTYFPPEDRWGRPGFPRVLAGIAAAFHQDAEGVADNARRLGDYIAAVESGPGADGARAMPEQASLRAAGDALLAQVDLANGGLGGAPKFPNAMLFTYLWRLGWAAGEAKYGEAARLALTRMAAGGIYDQLGGGFHRYSVDDTWSVPHFEKMLYDNGLLLKLYAEAVLNAGPELPAEERALYLRVLEETVAYLLREMRSSEGMFFAAQDADSEGEEGKYFVWDPRELAELLTPEEAAAFAARYGVTEAGNFEHGKTVLYLAAPLAPGSDALITSARAKLKAARDRRIAPGTDHKILCSWNGLAISGLAWAAQALREGGRAEAAERAWAAAEAAFAAARDRLGREGDRLWSTWQGGRGRHNGYLDDYAFLARAALDLSRFTEEEMVARSRLTDCARWLGAVRKHFGDPAGAGYFFTSDDHENLIQRLKTLSDQAIPSGTSVVLECALALGELGWPGFETGEEVRAQLSALFPATARNPYGAGELLCAGLLSVLGPLVLVGAGDLPLAHPAVFRKAGGAPGGNGWQLCHRGTCGLPVDAAEARESAEALTRFS